MARPYTHLGQLAAALKDKPSEFELDQPLAGLISLALNGGPAKARGELAMIFERGRSQLERELVRELGHDAPQKAKDMMREEFLAAMERLLAAVTADIRAYASADGRRFVRK